MVRVLHPPVFDDDLLLDDLQPSMEYHFTAVVGSPLGVSEPILANATTPIGEQRQRTREYCYVHDN